MRIKSAGSICFSAVLFLFMGVFSAMGVAGPAPIELHFQPEETVLGDVIPFFWEGIYHIFYLRGSGWGHISSKDLVHWEELPNAIESGQEADAPDRENCWTGSIVEHGGVFHLFYTGKNSRDPKGDQKVMHATSHDLITWIKRHEDTFYADGSIYWNKSINGPIDNKLIYHHQAFRDPEVFWSDTTGDWRLLLHAALADGSAPAIALYSSDDLTHWKPEQPLLVLPKTSSGDCPHLFEMNNRWYLLSAEHHYTSSENPLGPFAVTMRTFDTGDLFVPKTMFDGKRRILFGWIGHREENRDEGKPLWGGVLSMPREMFTDTEGNLCQRPVQEIGVTFDRTILNLTGGPVSDQILDVPKDFMLHCEIQSASNQGKMVLRFRQTASDEESGYHLKIDLGNNTVDLGGARFQYQQVVGLNESNPVSVDLFVMGSVCECFVENSYCFTMRIYNFPNGGVSFPEIDPGVEIRNFQVKTLE
ncbi:MAG: family 43 glycosylhydrolase [Candidatus Omnitrophica bacterium]|nr:family 43 glycosylhydrolase [Candidatus Omnitrophota bacterium]